jgi:hypothetical protein
MEVAIQTIVLMDKEAMAKLKLAMLESETVAQLAALIVDFTHEEMMLVFDELEWEQQARITAIWKTAPASINTQISSKGASISVNCASKP